MKIEHALIAIDRQGKIIHLISYESPPMYADYFHMVDELKTDRQFGLTHLKAGKDFIVAPADQHTLEMIMETMNENPEVFEVVEHGLAVTE